MSNQYEVDVVQDIRYELGDVIRLETQKNVFKTCVITGLKFNFPGSKGHVTCRKIFNIADSSYALSDVINAKIVTDGAGITVLEAENGTCVVGKMKWGANYYFIIVGATKFQTSSVVTDNITVTDNNSHVWQFRNFLADGRTYTFTPVDLGEYDSTKCDNAYAYGAMTLVMKLYEEQGMTSPVDYDCAYTVT